MPVGTWGRYLPTSHLVYVNNGTLFAVPFDTERLEVRGPATPVLEDVAYSTASGSAQNRFFADRFARVSDSQEGGRSCDGAIAGRVG